MKIKQSLFVLFVLILSISNYSFAAKFRNELPHVRIVEIRPAVSTKLEVGETEKVIEKDPNSNIIVGEDILPMSKLVMECDARYPVQWVYNGDGMPEYSTNTTATKTPEEHTRPDPLFIASISLGFGRPIGAQDSGKYTCRSLQNPDLSVYYHLYVTDENLFSSPGGEEIYYKKTDPSVRIPCSVSNPKAVVSLQKSLNGLVQCPLNESITYDATKGFELKVSSYFDPAGIYVCTAGYNNTFQVVRYTLVPETINVPYPSNIMVRSCQKNDDCASNQACIQDKSGYSCTSPCSHVCGRNTQCNTVNHVPRCYCLPGHRGDAYKACFQNVQSQVPDRIEKDACTPTPCGQNTQCDRIGSTARCSCAPGFQGDPYVRCYHKDVCQGNPCGPNSQCTYKSGYASCSCRPGYYGQPPYCRAECETESHCAGDRTCIYGRCGNPCDGACQQFAHTECRVIRRQAVCARIQTRCPTGYYGRDCTSIYTKTEESISVNQETKPSISACQPFPCGEKAECLVKTIKNSELNTTSQVALCQCPPRLTGNADVECYPVAEQLARNDSEETGSFENTTGTTISEATNTTDECRPGCGIHADCTEKNVCSCRKNYQGNPYMKCTPVSCKTVEDCETPNATCVYGKCYETGTVTEAKSCGINAISIVSDDGKSVCSCPAGYTGIASIECHLIKNDETKMGVNGTNLSTIDDACKRTPCGKNAICNTGDGGIAVCECIEPFQGNPWIGCELNCTKNSDCPSAQLCYDISHKCVDPCDSNYQAFFTQCGRDARCKVEDHVPFCYCPETHPHGSPHLHCKEKSWMPNHRVSNSTCTKTNLKCGKHTSCIRFHDSNEYCVCLPGFFGDPNEDVGCKLGLQCRRDLQCGSAEECVNGKCLNACRKHKCGKLAGCRAENHKALCTCHIGTIQNPKGECIPVTGALAERVLFYRSYEDFK